MDSLELDLLAALSALDGDDRVPPPSPTPPDAPAPGTPARSKYPPWLVESAVPRYRHDDPRALRRIRKRLPTVLTDCPLAAPAVEKWDFDYLSAGMSQTAEVPVHVTAADVNSFPQVYGSSFAKGDVEHMTFAAFREAAKREAAKPRSADGRVDGGKVLYMQLPLGSMPARLPDDDSDEDPEERFSAAPQLGDAVHRDVCGFGWSWVQGVAADAGFLQQVESCQLWAGLGGSVTPCHYDVVENFFAQIRGRKRFLLFSPAESWRLYPHATNHPLDRKAMVKFDAPDLERYPDFKDARCVEAVLGPGDVLFVPRFWWHHVLQVHGDTELDSVENLGCNFWTRPRPLQELARQVPKVVVPMLAHRQIESAAIRSIGSEGEWGAFLEAMANGADAQWPPNSQQRGLAQHIRQVGAQSLEGCAVSVDALLRSMCAGGRLTRLRPKAGRVEAVG